VVVGLFFEVTRCRSSDEGYNRVMRVLHLVPGIPQRWSDKYWIRMSGELECRMLKKNQLLWFFSIQLFNHIGGLFVAARNAFYRKELLVDRNDNIEKLSGVHFRRKESKENLLHSCWLTHTRNTSSRCYAVLGVLEYIPVTFTVTHTSSKLEYGVPVTFPWHTLLGVLGVLV
jgi:hypothetical protein